MLDENNDHLEGAAAVFHPGTISAVKRRLRIVQRGNNRIFTQYDPVAGYEYDSSLPDIICALERGRVLIVDTTLMSEMEQFLLTTVVARVLFSLRKALRSADTSKRRKTEIRCALGNDDANGLMEMKPWPMCWCRGSKMVNFPT